MKRKEKRESVSKVSYERIAFFLIGAGALLILLTTVSLIVTDISFIGFTIDSSEILGQLGEYIGGLVGSIWSLAGIVLFYETLKFQRSELKLQREELQYQREEIMEQTNQYILQNQTLLTRKLEGTYFQIVSLHNEIVGSLIIEPERHKKIGSKMEKLSGRYCFKAYYKYFSKIFTDNVDLTGISMESSGEMRDLISESFLKFYSEFQEDIGHYLRNLFNLALFVDKSRLINKRFYYNLMRSLLSNYELVLVFYYCFTKDAKDLKKLAEKYSLFVQLPENELLDRRHMSFFKPSAFKEETDFNIDDTPNVNLRKMD